MNSKKLFAGLLLLGAAQTTHLGSYPKTTLGLGILGTILFYKNTKYCRQAHIEEQIANLQTEIELTNKKIEETEIELVDAYDSKPTLSQEEFNKRAVLFITIASRLIKENRTVSLPQNNPPIKKDLKDLEKELINKKIELNSCKTELDLLKKELNSLI